MNKKRLAYIAVAAITLCGMATPAAYGQDPDKYANIVAAENFGTINPTGNFSIQAKLNAGETFAYQAANGKKFTYTAGAMAAFSFLVDLTADTAGVWGGGVYVGRLAISPFIFATEPGSAIGGQNLINTASDPGAQTGIYSTINKFRNPGFENYAVFTTGDEATLANTSSFQDTRGWPSEWYLGRTVVSETNTGQAGGTVDVVWSTLTARWRAQNTKVNTSTAQRNDGTTYEVYGAIRASIEGVTTVMVHNPSTNLFWQDITGGLKANTWYKAQWRQMGHADTSGPATWTAYITIDSAAVAENNANVIAQYDYTSPEAGVTIDPIFAFLNPTAASNVFFIIGKKTNTINHLDMMTFQELAPGQVGYIGGVAITTPAIEVSWEDGLSVPQGGGGIIYEDVTSTYLVNASFDENLEGQVNVSTYNPVTIADAWPNTNNNGNNGGVNQPVGWTVEYAVSSQTGDIWDQASVNDGRTPAIVNSGGTTPDVQGGNLPKDGPYFFYYRSRWMSNQDFAIQQTTQVELPAGYYNIVFWAAAPDGGASNPMTVSIPEEDQSIVIDQTALAQYTIPVNLVAPKKLTFRASQFRGVDAASSMLLDGIQIIYCGEADEAAALQIALNKITNLYDQLYHFSPDPMVDLPSGAIEAFLAAEEAYMGIDETDLANVLEVLEKLTNAVAICEAAAPIYAQLRQHWDEAEALQASEWAGLEALMEACDKAMAVIEDFENSYLADDIQAADDALVTAMMVYQTTQPASLDAPADFTFVIKNPRFDDGNTGWSAQGWGNFDGANTQYPGWSDIYLEEGIEAPATNFVLDAGATNSKATQTITNLPAGLYSVSAVARAHVDSRGVALLINNGTTEYSIPVSPDGDQTAGTYGFGGWSDYKSPRVYLPQGANLTIGAYAGTVGQWESFDNFRLTYYSNDEDAVSGELAERIDELMALLDENADYITGAEEAYARGIVAAAEAATSKEEMIALLPTFIVATDTVNYAIQQYNNFLTNSIDAAYIILADPLYTEGELETFDGIITDVNLQFVAASAEGSTQSVAIYPVLKAILDKATADFIWSAQIVKVKDIEAAGVLVGASRENPVDLTDFINNPTIEGSDIAIRPDGWNAVYGPGDKYTNVQQHWSGDASNRYLDCWQSAAGTMKYTAYQDLIVPNGLYRLGVRARTDGYGVYIFASGNDTLQIANNGAVGGAIWEEAEEGSDIKLANGGTGWGWTQYYIETRVYNSNRLRIGISNHIMDYKPNLTSAQAWTGTWYSADDWTLELIEEGWRVGIEEVGEADFTAYAQDGYIVVTGAESYTITTISGVAVPATGKLTTGIYLVTANGKTVKVAVK